MRSIYISELPPDVISSKDLNPLVPINGGMIASAELCKALVRHSSLDLILFPRQRKTPGADLRDSTAFTGATSRVRFVNNTELLALSTSVDGYFSTSWGLPALSHLRANSSCLLPAGGLTHSFCSPDVLQWFQQLYLAPIVPGDYLVCTSNTARTVVTRLLSLVGETWGLSRCAKCPEVDLPIIPLGLEEDYIQPCAAKPEAVNVLYLGRFSPQSKADLVPLLIAWSRLPSLSPPTNVSLTLAGDDTQFTLAPRILEMASSLGIDNLTVVPNPSDKEKRALLDASHIFVSPSDTLQETFGLSIVEAMAAGLPTIATDWSGYRDLIEDGVSGFLIPTILATTDTYVGAPVSALFAQATAFDIDLLSRRLAQLITRPELRHSMGSAGRIRFEQTYTWRKIIKIYDEYWLRAKANPSRTRRESVSTWNPRVVFGHYASALLKEDMSVEVSADMSQLPIILTHISESMPFDTRALIASMLDTKTRQVSELVRFIQNAKPGISGVTVIGVLLKYGVLQLVP